jgi:hypothetical protein
MKPRRAYWLGFVLLLGSLGLAQDRQEAPNVLSRVSEEEALLQRGTLKVWVPETHIMGEWDDPTAKVIVPYKWRILLSEFKTDFPGFNLDFQILDRDEFVKRMHSSEDDSLYPDVAFVNNYGELGPLLNDNAVVKMLGQSRFHTSGWWVIFRRAKNFEVGKAFMLWLSQSPHWKPWQAITASISPGDIEAVEGISKEAVHNFADTLPQSRWSIMDPSASHFDDFGPDAAQTLQSVEPLLTFGNSRLAFVLLAEVGQGENTFGMDHSAVILRKLGDAWKVLLFLPSRRLPDLEDLLRTFDSLALDDGGPDGVPKVTLLAPADRSQLVRVPPPTLEWTPVGRNLAAYVIETQFNQGVGEHWVPSWIKIISDISNQSPIRMEAPIGVGQQPHRWRVWAISRSGIVSISDFRVIDYTK